MAATLLLSRSGSQAIPANFQQFSACVCSVAVPAASSDGVSPFEGFWGGTPPELGYVVCQRIPKGNRSNIFRCPRCTRGQPGSVREQLEKERTGDRGQPASSPSVFVGWEVSRRRRQTSFPIFGQGLHGITFPDRGIAVDPFDDTGRTNKKTSILME